MDQGWTALPAWQPCRWAGIAPTPAGSPCLADKCINSAPESHSIYNSFVYIPLQACLPTWQAPGRGLRRTSRWGSCPLALHAHAHFQLALSAHSASGLHPCPSGALLLPQKRGGEGPQHASVAPPGAVIVLLPAPRCLAAVSLLTPRPAGAQLALARPKHSQRPAPCTLCCCCCSICWLRPTAAGYRVWLQSRREARACKPEWAPCSLWLLLWWQAKLVLGRQTAPQLSIAQPHPHTILWQSGGATLASG